VDGAPLVSGETRALALGQRLRVELAAVTLEWVLTHHEVAPGAVPGPRVERPAADKLRLVLPHYEGRRRTLRWRDFRRAVSGYTLRMAASGEALPPEDGLAAPLPETMPPSQQAAEAWGFSREHVVV